jgi:hypothetical protein
LISSSLVNTTQERYPTNFLGDNDSVVAEGVGSSGVAERSSGVTERSSGVRQRSSVRVSHNWGGLGVGVSNGNWGSDVLDNRSNSGVSMTLHSRPGKITTKTIRLDDGTVVLGSADQVRSRDEGSLGDGEESEENGQLQHTVR